jgi:hypothetical protein
MHAHWLEGVGLNSLRSRLTHPTHPAYARRRDINDRPRDRIRTSLGPELSSPLRTGRAGKETMMLPDDIWKFAPEAMTEAERDRFFEDGCLVLENAIAADWLARLRAAVDEMIEHS